jgi:channel protein (hemolysin III family)
LGVTLKAFDRLSHPWLSTGLYLIMGWLVLIAAVPLVQRVPLPGVALLVAGGVAYTTGVLFFMLDSPVALRARGMAQLRCCRHRLPLFRGAELLGVTSHRGRESG